MFNLSKSTNVLIDAHIHIHECYNLDKFFNSAKANFLKQANILDLCSNQFILCLTESHKVNYFNQLKQNADKSILSEWKIDLTENPNTIKLVDKENFTIYLIAGRQIVTNEKLEVLTLGLIEDPEDGKPIEEILAYVSNKKVISVIPWGVGKWMGYRKEIIEKLVLQNNTFPIYLGDNGNRPFFWSKPKIFSLAAKNNMLNIPGSDPLPFKNEVNKPGSFGFVLEGVLDIEKPFDSLFEKITSSKKQFATYGRLESLFNFFKNQISMQIVKRNR
ncbi:MAG: hypothetical protein KDC88_02225 [Ignavibacteriae bacterium]|nr:hypothetical protein [Ignavibacteriota bacterium]MCB9207945.1 hypothetical protein [Ignavibacteriales bacterium]